MRAFVDLDLCDQAALVLISLLEDVANNKRTMAGIEHHVHGLYNLLSENFNVPSQEVDLAVSAVAKSGIELLPGFEVGDKPAKNKPNGGSV